MSGGPRRVALFAVLACAACLHDHLVPCGDDLCPVDYVCTSAGACADPGAAAACEGKQDGDVCMLDATTGTCWHGACHPAACGNGIVDVGEVCDDGNNVVGDGCSADCKSDEMCGNGAIDPIKNEQCDEGVAGQSGDGCTSLCTFEVDIWRDKTPDPISAAQGLRLAFDSRRGVTVLYGGFSSTVSGRTWEWNGVSWRVRALDVVPPARAHAGLTYDSARHRTVLFAGTNLFGIKYDDTWEWDGVQWSDRSPATSPSVRSDVAMAYDPNRGRTVLFGGIDASGASVGDTWEWDGTAWNQIQVSGPGPRFGAMMAFDPISNKLVLFGGIDSTTATLQDTWTYDGTSWAKLLPANKPSARWDGYVATCGTQIALFGGTTTFLGSYVGDLWTWNGTNWISSTNTGPAPRAHGGFAYDSARGRCVLYGGATNTTTFGDLWELAGTTWAPVVFDSQPKGRIDHGLAYDPLRGRVVLFAGSIGGLASNDTWEWDGINWLVQTPATSPPARATASLTYDERLRSVVVFGGGVGAAGNDLWAWNGSNWSPLPAMQKPPPRTQLALAYDRDRDRLVMFGGSESGTNVADTWEWDGATWTDVTPAVSPSPRRNARLAYDPKRKRSVLFGGGDDPNIYGDVWEWDGSSWTPVTTTSLLLPVYDPGVTYDAVREVLFGFGGTSYFGASTDISFDYAGSVVNQMPAVSPSGRGETALAYDLIAHRAVTFSGTKNMGAPPLQDTWTHGFESFQHPPEACFRAEQDTDGDGLAGCADPDCQGRCNPLCPYGVACDPNAPHCGDGVCGAVEDYLICPTDCAAP